MLSQLFNFYSKQIFLILYRRKRSEIKKSNQHIYNNVNIMSLTADQAKTQINILINSNKIQHINNFIALPNDTHRYRYNPNKELSKIFRKYCLKNFIILYN